MSNYDPPNKMIENKHEPDINFLNLANQIMALDGINAEVLTGQKGLAGSDVIAVEIIKAGAATKLVEVITGWLFKDRSRSLRLKIENSELEVQGLTQEEQQKLINLFQTHTGLYIEYRK